MVKFATLLTAGAIALGALVGAAPVDTSGAQARRHYNEANPNYSRPSFAYSSDSGPRTVTVTVDRYIDKLPGGGYTTMLTPPADYSDDSTTPPANSGYSSGPPSYSSDSPAPSAQYTSGGAPSGWQQDMLQQVNAVRAQNGKPAVTMSQQLTKMAQAQSDYQASAKTMTHDNPSGSLGSRCSSVGIKWSGVAENVAWNQQNVKEVMDAWINSPGHFENMIGDYNEVGFAVNNLYWTQDYAKV
ncbi:hypothetical protein IW140_005684 [Coemansia sp. RSA 1813]|nr:hypothetical protein EV178_005323 [Coemansia sp. RSA 1646]KAJ1767275.1 hypothetical protein LPJ74_005455 [Coemansia sp. RSA 1843]KAJ2092266.1 hypothetical protein IW138_001337 [Coemansia sp. RSA 986]KAJ2211083.1 hypothetical protein EV179_005772 [Coemansia sp. RSA 487]KAJ2564615.1 hypothetical protein IW140_005684 [Coemansia sp. RSA 1813]